MTGPAPTPAAEPAAGMAVRPWRALIWVLGAVASFSVMAVAGREAQAQLNVFELMAWRSAIGWLVVCAVLAFHGFAQIRSRNPRLHVQRNLAHFTGQVSWLYALPLIPFAQLVALEFTSPLWVAVLAPLLLGEAMTRRRMMAVALGFAGVLIVAQPGAVEPGAGHAAALVAALGLALNTLFTRRILAHDSVLCVLFWMTLSQTFMALAIAVPLGMRWPAAAIWPWVILVAITGLTAHVALSNALRHAPAVLVAPMDFLRLPVIALVGMLLYGEPLLLSVFVGALVIFAGNLMNLTGAGGRRQQRGNSR